MFRRWCTPGIWPCLRFWICQRSDYTRIIYQGCEYAKVLNMLGFWIYHRFKYVRVTQGSKYAWTCLISSWICLIIPECAYICLNRFCFTFTHCNPTSKVFMTVSLESKNLIFSTVTGSIWFCFLFLDWMFLQVRFQIYCYLWGLWILPNQWDTE